jgi:hypothetical protein
MPKILNICRERREKRVKLKTKPTMMPNGFLLSPVAPPARIKGKIGRMQGEKTSPIPSKKARLYWRNASCMDIFLLNVILTYSKERHK